MAQQFKTIKDLMSYTYGGGMVGKADAPVISTTTGVFNAVYGAMAFSQLNAEGNAFALMPKYPWQHSGYRAITADAGSAATGGIAENGAVPETIKPTFAEISVPVKEVAHSFESSYRIEGLIKKGQDDAIGTMEQLRPYFAALHAKRINEMLLKDGDTLAGNNFESLDRVTASAAYATAVSWTAADEDIYGIDRSAAAWADAVVSHNSGTDRVFTMSILESHLASLETKGARTNLLITGPDTKWRIIGIANSSVRYAGVVSEGNFKVGINGVEADEGLQFGRRVTTVYNIPLYSSQSVAQDTIARIYCLDTTIQEGTGIPRLGVSLLYPTMYFEAGMSAAQPNPFVTGTFGTKGVFYTAGELVCTFLAVQGSIRDLK